jgi:hypothetical protein
MNSKRWAGLSALVLVAILLLFFHGRVPADFWPLDASRVGPNLVASVIQWALIALVLYLAYPPVRRAIDQAVKRHTAELHEKLDHNARLLQHVIKHHPDIPNEDHNGVSLIGEKK